ncbi:MAG: T9SS type A sorting domain-containing protein [Bacteroidota bacterium]
MKRYFRICLSSFVFLCFSSVAQINLVPNPSFEDTINCPYQAGDIGKAVGWTSLCGSPDYFSTCNQFDWGVPTNIFGFQQPASGNSYAGFITYSDVMLNTREFPACNLISPLSIGTKYFISFKIALSLENIANPTNCASDKTGLKFTMGNSICNSLINNNPPVFTSTIISDSLNWTRVAGSFIADSAYTMVVIGNFFDDSNTDTTKFFNSWWSDFAYYHVDDVCVSTDSVYANNYNYTGIQTNQAINSFICYPNPLIDKLTIQNQSNEKMTIEVYNGWGEMLMFRPDVFQKVTTIDCGNIPPGILFVKITSGQQIHTYKLLKL